MIETNTNELYRLAAEIFGRDNQCTVAMEELSELQKEICKQLRGIGDREHLAEEIADAKIMIEQLVLLFDIKERVAEVRGQKLLRLEQSISGARARRPGRAAPGDAEMQTLRSLLTEMAKQVEEGRSCYSCTHLQSPDDEPPCSHCKNGTNLWSDEWANAPDLWEPAQKGESQ